MNPKKCFFYYYGSTYLAREIVLKMNRNFGKIRKFFMNTAPTIFVKFESSIRFGVLCNSISKLPHRIIVLFTCSYMVWTHTRITVFCKILDLASKPYCILAKFATKPCSLRQHYLFTSNTCCNV